MALPRLRRPTLEEVFFGCLIFLFAVAMPIELYRFIAGCAEIVCWFGR